MSDELTLERKLEAYRLMYRLLCDDVTFVRNEKQTSPLLRPASGEFDLAFMCEEGFLDGEPVFSINVGDTFAYACADAEDISLPQVFEVAETLRTQGWAGLVRWVQAQREARGHTYRPIKPVEESCLQMEEACAQRDAAQQQVVEVRKALKVLDSEDRSGLLDPKNRFIQAVRRAVGEE